MSKKGFLSFKYGSSKNSSLKQAHLSIPRERKMADMGNCQPNIEEMKQVFEKFDSNKDGKISKNEYKLAARALGKETAEKAFQIMDSDGDGFIDFDEFMEVQNMGGGVKKSDIQSAFRVFDLDGNGKISAEELMAVLRKLGERSSLKTCRKMVKGVDKDGDGLIDMEEFMSMMTITSKTN